MASARRESIHLSLGLGDFLAHRRSKLCLVAEVFLGAARATDHEFLFTALDGVHARSAWTQGVPGPEFLCRFDYRLDLRCPDGSSSTRVLRRATASRPNGSTAAPPWSLEARPLGARAPIRRSFSHPTLPGGALPPTAMRPDLPVSRLHRAFSSKLLAAITDCAGGDPSCRDLWGRPVCRSVIMTTRRADPAVGADAAGKPGTCRRR